MSLVYVSVPQTDRAGWQVEVGTEAHIDLLSTPVRYSLQRGSGGRISGTGMVPWGTSTVSEMQVCYALDAPCKWTDEWIVFRALAGKGVFQWPGGLNRIDLKVDWVGPRILWFGARFRDAGKNTIPSVSADEKEPQQQLQIPVRITGIWNEATPLADQPPVVLTAVAATRAAYPVTGSVLIDGGNCCLGGTAGGPPVNAQAAFSAASPFGAVTGMRVRTASGGGCYSEAELGSAPWEPFAAGESFPVDLGINWIGFYVTVQFRDEAGNLSAVYCDDISVEGMPALPQVDASDWFPKIQCFSEKDVHPGQAESVTGAKVKFSWPERNRLPEGVFYKVSVFAESDGYTATVASGQTRENSIALSMPAGRAGDMAWYLTLVDANGTFLDHGRCSTFPPSLLTVDPPSGIKGVHFLYKP